MPQRKKDKNTLHSKHELRQEAGAIEGYTVPVSLNTVSKLNIV